MRNLQLGIGGRRDRRWRKETEEYRKKAGKRIGEGERRNEKVNRWLNMKQYVEGYVQRGSANRKREKPWILA